MSFTSHWVASRVRGPWIRWCIGPYLSNYHTKIYVIIPPCHRHATLLRTSLTFLTPTHIWEHRSMLALMVLVPLLLQYFSLCTSAHSASFSVWNLQFSLVSKAIFFPFTVCNPRPPSSLDSITFCHPTQWILFWASEVPHKKFLFNRSIPSNTLLGR